MVAAERLALAAFLARAETEPASEYVCGEVIRKPAPNETHGALQLFLGALIRQFLLRSNVGRVRTEWRCISGPAGRKRALVPDVVMVSHERYAAEPPGADGLLRIAPDFVIEIRSPGQSAARFAGKVQFYLRNGVRLLWVVDPRYASVTVYRPDADEETLHAGDVLTGGDVLPGFEVSIDDIVNEIPRKSGR
jgi:Uma2 family endonuclease